MGKTRNDEVYERGVHDGQRAGFLEDLGSLACVLINNPSYDKGYKYGAEHRYDSAGQRYHTCDGKGINDKKDKKKCDKLEKKVENPEPSTSYDDDDDDLDYYEPKKKIEEHKPLEKPKPLCPINIYTRPETIKKAIESGLYSGLYIQPPIYWLTYKCDKCGNEYESIHNSYEAIQRSEKCRMGCSEGFNEGSLLGFIKIFLSLFTGKPAFGHAKLISETDFGP